MSWGIAQELRDSLAQSVMKDVAKRCERSGMAESQ